MHMLKVTGTLTYESIIMLQTMIKIYWPINCSILIFQKTFPDYITILKFPITIKMESDKAIKTKDKGLPRSKFEEG